MRAWDHLEAGQTAAGELGAAVRGWEEARTDLQSLCVFVGVSRG